MFIKLTSGTVMFNTGTITTNSNRVEVDNSATACVSTGNITSFVNGNLRRYLLSSGAYNWPVGNVSKGYQRAYTNFSSNSNTYIDARFDSWPATSGYPPIQAGSECGVTYDLEAEDNGYWTLTSTGSAAIYNMTLYPYNATNTGGAAAWTIMKKPAIGPMPGWILDGTCVASTATIVNRNGLSGFSVFGVAQAVLPLPTEMIDFSGQLIGEDNLLVWNTGSEHNNDYFTLERSRNGYDFEVLAIVDGAGNSTSQLHYEEFDLDPYPSTYYRLKQTDFDGQFVYSQTISSSRTNESTSI